VNAFHAINMSISFLIFVPLGIIIIRYFRHRPNISFLHGALMSLTSDNVLTSAVYASITQSSTPQLQSHRIVGIVTAVLVCLTITFAVVFTNLRRFGGVNASWWMRFRSFHEYAGWFVLAFGWANIGIALSFLWPGYLPIFYTSIAVVGATMVALESHAYMFNGSCSWRRHRGSIKPLRLSILSRHSENSARSPPSPVNEASGVEDGAETPTGQ